MLRITSPIGSLTDCYQKYNCRVKERKMKNKKMLSFKMWFLRDSSYPSQIYSSTLLLLFLAHLSYISDQCPWQTDGQTCDRTNWAARGNRGGRRTLSVFALIISEMARARCVVAANLSSFATVSREDERERKKQRKCFFEYFLNYVWTSHWPFFAAAAVIARSAMICLYPD